MKNFDDINENYLEHFGVKGMKWKVRNKIFDTHDEVHKHDTPFSKISSHNLTSKRKPKGYNRLKQRIDYVNKRRIIKGEAVEEALKEQKKRKIINRLLGRNTKISKMIKRAYTRDPSQINKETVGRVGELKFIKNLKGAGIK